MGEVSSAQTSLRWQLPMAAGAVLSLVAIAALLALGQPGRDPSPAPIGAGTWQQLGQTIEPEGAIGLWGGEQLAASANGRTIATRTLRVVSSLDTNFAPNPDSGIFLTTTVFTREGETWRQLGQLPVDRSDGTPHNAVALASDGRTLAVARQLDQSDHQVVQILRWDGVAWESAGEAIPAPEGRGSFGSTLALSADGNTVAIGDPGLRGWGYWKGFRLSLGGTVLVSAGNRSRP